MRCLQCGKELALLKRLTGGAEFCSEAHRKQYQDDFNNLALNRLLEPAPAVPAKPLELAPEPPAIEEEPPPPPAQNTPKPTPRAASRSSIQVPAKAAKPKEKEQEPVGKMVGYLIEQPNPGQLETSIAREELEFLPSLRPAYPQQVFTAQAGALVNELPWAKAVSAVSLSETRRSQIRPRQGSLDIREFSRKAVTPEVAPRRQTIDAVQVDNRSGEAMDITYQPIPPAGSLVIWHAGPAPESPVEPMLGDLARLDFGVEGFDAPRPSVPPAPSIQTAPLAASPEPIAATSIPAAPPVSQAVEIETFAAPAVTPIAERMPAVPAPAADPLPVTLHGIAAGAAQANSIVSPAMMATVPVQVPASHALPLRPVMVLGQKPVQQPKPASNQASTAQAAPEARAPKAVAKQRREVRVVQAPVKKQAVPAAAAAAPAKPVAVAQVAPKTTPPAKPAPSPQPVAKEKPQAAPAVPQSTPAKLPEPKPAPVSMAAPSNEVELNLPELHVVEVSGPWERLPMAAKAGIGGVLALLIIGTSYFLLNSNNAAATVQETVSAPRYEIGKQINTGGWIEDWAPLDTFRRVTLLRGTQPFTDYRIEFEAQIQNKAIGWMFRGVNPKNYYVAKIERVKGGTDTDVALVHYAVIDGTNEGRVEKILPLKPRLDTSYKIRFDAVGPEFTVWVQGQKMETWRDTRFGSGGLGLYSEGDEIAAVRGTVNAFELVSIR